MSWYNPASWFSSTPHQPTNAQIAAGNQKLANTNALPGGGNLLNGPSTNVGAISKSNPDGLTGALSPTAKLGGTTTTAGAGGSGGGGTGGGGSSGGAAAPTPGQNANGGSSNFLQATYQPAIGQLQSAYNSLFGTTPGQLGGEAAQTAGQAANNIANTYGTQQANLGQSFAQAQTQLPWEYAGRGAASSGWAGNAYNTAQNEFKNSEQGIQDAQAKDIANVDQQLLGQEGTYQGYLNQYNNPQLQAMLNSQPAFIQNEDLNAVLGNVGAATGLLGQNTPLNTAIQGIVNNPSYQQPGSAAIQGQLQALAGSGAPSAVQNQIAQGIIGNPSNPTNSNFLNYWQSLQGNQQNPQVSTV